MCCTCDVTSTHRVAKGQTADGIHLALWSTGALTGRFSAIDGVPVVRPRSHDALSSALDTGRMVIGDASLWDASELGAVYAAARKIVARGGNPGDLRSALASGGQPAICFTWTTLQADRDGTPTCRVARLPRIRWPGWCVWHEHGVYEIMTDDTAGPLGLRRDRDVLSPTGFSFSTQRELAAFLVRS